MSVESFVNEGIAISRWIGHEVTQSNRKRVLKELKSQYQWKSWQFRKEDHLENYCFSDENDDKRPVAQLDSDGAEELMNCVIYELKTNFKNMDI